MSRRIDKIEYIVFAVACLIRHSHGREFYGDTSFALQIHRVEKLVFHIAFRNLPGHFHNAVGKGRLTVVDMRDYAEISDIVFGSFCHRRILLRKLMMLRFYIIYKNAKFCKLFRAYYLYKSSGEIIDKIFSVVVQYAREKRILPSLRARRGELRNGGRNGLHSRLRSHLLGCFVSLAMTYLTCASL